MKKIYTVLVLVILTAATVAVAKSLTAPTHPELQIPSEWGKVIGYASDGETMGRDRTSILFEADDGTLRRLRFRGGERPELSHVIRRVQDISR